jgi:hypothetical protein
VLVAATMNKPLWPADTVWLIGAAAMVGGTSIAEVLTSSWHCFCTRFVGLLPKNATLH